MQLIKYDRARKALAEAHRVDEVKNIRDQAMAVALYARQANDADMIKWATEIKIRAERRAGELLRETAKTGVRQGRGRPRKKIGGSLTLLKTLAKLGISKQQAKDWRALAKISEREFERRLMHAARDPKTMTTARLLRAVMKPIVVDVFKEQKEVWSSVSGWLLDIRRLPKIEGLKQIRPTGGLRTALRENLHKATRYMAGLKRLNREDWL